MCGIAGYFSRAIIGETRHAIVDMTRSMRRRGPDDEGFVLIDTREDRIQDFCGYESDPQLRGTYPQIDDFERVWPHDLALGHRRFSIIDLSTNGHQPMWDAEERVCISFYGEIYNYVELRKELISGGAQFRTQSDTEVILQAYLRWGTGAFERFNGPFALALYDRRTRKVLLSRDRIGKASFYYTIVNDCLYWATEIKAFLVALGQEKFSVSQQAVHDFVTYGLRDFDGTFWNEIHDFPPASYAWIQRDLSLKTERYWQIPQSRRSTHSMDVRSASEELASLLSDAIRIRARADAPVAFELSGGMDSSAVVSLAASKRMQNLTAYTVKFIEPDADEEPYARAVVDSYSDRVDHRVLVPQKTDFWSTANEFVWTEEEPFHSPNLQTNQQLRKLMSDDGFKVVITGAAGDEVFAGYWGDYLGPFLTYLLGRGNLTSFFRELTRNSEASAARMACVTTFRALCPSGMARFIKRTRYQQSQRIGGILVGGSELVERIRTGHTFSETMLQNMGPWKMNYWLRSGSKANFGVPIEARAPFLDYRVVEFAFQLPPEYLIHDGFHKWILRMAVKDLLPRQVLWRNQKMGFPFPLQHWLVQSRQAISTNLSGLDCPYVDAGQLLSSYDRLVSHAPEVLWRLLSVCLWWRRVIEGRTLLDASGGPSGATARS